MRKFNLLILLVSYQYSVCNELFVIGDKVNIRENPNSNSKVIGKLLMDSKVVASKEKNGWRYIDFMIDKSKRIIKGWVHKSVLSKRIVSNKELKNKFEGTSNIKEKIKYQQRIVARNSFDKKQWIELKELYEISGDTNSAKWVDLKISAKNPIFIAIYDLYELRVVGMLDSNKKFHSLEIKVDHNSKNKPSNREINKIKKLTMELAGIRWYNQNSQFSFPRPQFKYNKNESPVDISFLGIALCEVDWGQKFNSPKSFLFSEKMETYLSTDITSSIEEKTKKKYLGDLLNVKNVDSNYIKKIEIQQFSNYGTKLINMNNGIIGLYKENEKVWPINKYKIIYGKDDSALEKSYISNWFYPIFSNKKNIFSILKRSPPENSNLGGLFSWHLFLLEQNQLPLIINLHDEYNGS